MQITALAVAAGEPTAAALAAWLLFHAIPWARRRWPRPADPAALPTLAALGLSLLHSAEAMRYASIGLGASIGLIIGAVGDLVVPGAGLDLGWLTGLAAVLPQLLHGRTLRPVPTTPTPEADSE